MCNPPASFEGPPSHWMVSLVKTSHGSELIERRKVCLIKDKCRYQGTDRRSRSHRANSQQRDRSYAMENS